MSNTCNGRCETSDQWHHESVTSQLYAKGLKMCSVCYVAIDWEGTFCPCCSVRLRTKPQNKKRKHKSILEIAVKRY